MVQNAYNSELDLEQPSQQEVQPQPNAAYPTREQMLAALSPTSGRVLEPWEFIKAVTGQTPEQYQTTHKGAEKLERLYWDYRSRWEMQNVRLDAATERDLADIQARTAKLTGSNDYGMKRYEQAVNLWGKLQQVIADIEGGALDDTPGPNGEPSEKQRAIDAVRRSEGYTQTQAAITASGIAGMMQTKAQAGLGGELPFSDTGARAAAAARGVGGQPAGMNGGGRPGSPPGGFFGAPPGGAAPGYGSDFSLRPYGGGAVGDAPPPAAGTTPPPVSPTATPAMRSTPSGSDGSFFGSLGSMTAVGPRFGGRVPRPVGKPRPTAKGKAAPAPAIRPEIAAEMTPDKIGKPLPARTKAKAVAAPAAPKAGKGDVAGAIAAQQAATGLADEIVIRKADGTKVIWNRKTGAERPVR